jgi:hypothetical protein
MPGKSFWDMFDSEESQSESSSQRGREPATQQPAGNAAAQEELQASKKKKKKKKGPIAATILTRRDVDVPTGEGKVPDTEWEATINVGRRHGVKKYDKVTGGGLGTGTVKNVYPTASKIRWYYFSAPPMNLTVDRGNKYTRKHKRKKNEERRKAREQEEAQGAFEADFESEYGSKNPSEE